jgi:hypothetical protein
VTIVTAALMFAWTIGRVLTSTEPLSVSPSAASRLRSAPVHGALALCAAGLVGILCLLPTYVSFFHEAAGVHVRRDPLPRDEAVDNNALDPGALVTSVSPHFALLKLQNPALWRKTDVSSVSLYTGAAALVLALVGFAVAPRSGWLWFLAALGLIWIGIAVGSVLPLRGWLYDWVYPTRFFRHAAMFRLYFVFTLTVLALLGAASAATTVMMSPAARRRCGVAAVTVAAAACVIYWSALPADTASLPDAVLGRWHLGIVWGGMAVVGTLLLATRGGLSFVAILLVALAATDAAFAASLTRNTMFSSSPGDIAWWHGEVLLHEPDIDLTRRGLLRTLQACEINPPCTEPNTWGMITKVPALSTYTASTNPFYEETMADTLLSQTAIGPARLWFSPRAAQVDLDPAMFRSFLDRTRALGGIPIVVHDEQSMLDPTRRSVLSQPTLEQLPQAERIPATVERYTADALSVTIDAPSAGWLLVTERWARSWRAAVDGRAAPIYGGNFVFRALEVPQGKHRVEFTYQPLALPWLVATSWMTILVVAIGSVVMVRRQRA